MSRSRSSSTTRAGSATSCPWDRPASCRTPDTVDSMTLFGKEVLPRLKAYKQPAT